jgi:cytidylate kinase
MIIAIDGPAGAGKSTVARALARELGLVFLDTGAMYRAVTLEALRRGVDPQDAAGCEEVARSLALDFDAEGRVRIDGEPGEPAIRTAAVDAAVSAVSAHPGVRRAIVPLQRAVAERGPGVVAEGRDTATVVFPGADHKFYLTASAAERARRRAAQTGRADERAEIQADIERRDALDSSRGDSPLRRAPGAEEVDTDGLSIGEVVRALLERVRAARRP